MTVSLIFIPFLLVILLNIPRLSGRFAYYTALTFFVYQLISVFFPQFGSMQLAEIINKVFYLNIYADGISKIMIISAYIVAFTALMTSKAFIKYDRRHFALSNLMLLSVAGMNACFARDVFTLYVFIEIIAVTSYIMIALDKKQMHLKAALNIL